MYRVMIRVNTSIVTSTRRPIPISFHSNNRNQSIEVAVNTIRIISLHSLFLKWNHLLPTVAWHHEDGRPPATGLPRELVKLPPVLVQLSRQMET